VLKILASLFGALLHFDGGAGATAGTGVLCHHECVGCGEGGEGEKGASECCGAVHFFLDVVNGELQ
jgi:hypothetical protein